jgi:hypothetical protein
MVAPSASPLNSVFDGRTKEPMAAMLPGWFTRWRARSGPQCSFYPTSAIEAPVIVGPALSICAGCVGRCQAQVSEWRACSDPDPARWRVPPALHERGCAFCERTPSDVALMLAHAVGSICDECVARCVALLAAAEGAKDPIAW